MKNFSFRNLIALPAAIISIVAMVTMAYAGALTKSPAEMAPGDTSTLDSQLTAAATSMTLNPVKKWINGVRTTGCFHTGSGFILIQDFLGRTEYASYGNKSCSASNVTTLSNLRRGLSLTSPGFTAGTGLAFDAGATVKVVDYTVVYNYALKKDLPNRLIDSGSVICTSTGQPCFFTAGVTTAQRDAFSFGTASGLYPEIMNTTLGVRQYWNGSSWVNYGSGSTVNATTTISGKGELATIEDIKNSVITGDSGSPTFLWVSNVTRTSTGSTQANKIPALGTSGRMSGSLLGSGTTNSGTVLFGDGQWRNLNYFGTCADGDVTITTGTTTTLTADKHYSNLTIQSGAYLKPAGYRIFVCNTLKVYGGGFIRANGSGGILANAGTAASGTTPGTGGAGAPAAHGAGTLPAPKAGVAGGAGGAALSCNGSNRNGSDGAVGTAGNAETVGIGSAAVAGGTGGAGGDGGGGGGTPGNGGAGGALGATSITDATVMFNALLQSLAGTNPRTFAGSGSGGGGGGGGGGASDSACASGNNGAGGGGGGSGSPGGNMDVFTRVLSGSGTIQANGGSGGDGGAGGGCGAGTTDGGGGGGNAGAPGNGGTIMLVYNLLSSWTGTIQALAGSAGTPGTAGSSGCETAGAAGSAPTASAGQVFQYQVR